MSPERLDDLLSRALQTGVIPQDATPEEREELEPLLERAEDVRLNAALVRAEAAAAMPAARARFQRHLQAARQAPAVPSVTHAPKAGLFGRMFGGRAAGFAATAAALGVIAVVALAVLQPWGSPGSAAALTVDDYVQLQGVVASAEGGVVTVASPDFGNLEVALSDLTTVVAADGETRELRRGDAVVIAGVATAKRAIAASAVSVAEMPATPPPERPDVRVLKEFRAIEGTIKLVSLSPDGSGARVLLRTRTESLLVNVDRASIDDLLTAPGGALEAHVRVVQLRGAPRGVFGLALVNGAQGTPEPGAIAAAPQFQNVRGIVVSRNLNVFTIRTSRGDVPVVIRPATVIRLGQSGLTLADIREGETVIGHEVVVSGNLNPRVPRGIIAEVVAVLPKPAP